MDNARKNTKFIAVIIAFIMLLTTVFATTTTVNAASKTGAFTSYPLSPRTNSSLVTLNVAVSSKGNQTINVYYMKSGKWHYHSKLTAKCTKLYAKKFYSGSAYLSARYLTKGVKYKAVINTQKAHIGTRNTVVYFYGPSK